MLNREQEIWEALGITPTTNKREVKKAYAEAVKHCHPEEEPEAFQKLYEAYQAALNLCALRVKGQSVLQQEDISDIQTLPVETISESEETVVPENDARQEDNESYEKARQLFNQIPHEKSSKILPENDQQNKPFKLSDRESVQNSLPRDFNIEEIKKYETLFAQNSQRQQEVLLYWESLWKEYVAKPSSQNGAGLLQFMYSSDFSLIRDLDIVPRKIAAFYTKEPLEIPKDFLYALWDIFDYRNYDAVADQALYDLGYQKLYWILKKECDRYAEISIFGRHGKLAKNAKRIFYVGIFVLIVVVSFSLTIRTNEINRNRYPNRKAACARVRDALKEKYPDFLFSGGMYPPDNTEREYVIKAKIAPKGELLSRTQDICVTIVDDGKGNIVSYSDDFEKRSIQMLANKYGLHCTISLEEASEGYFLSVELTKAGTMEAQEAELANIYAVIQKDTVQNFNPSHIVFHVKDANNNLEKQLQYTFSDLPSQKTLLKEIWEG